MENASLHAEYTINPKLRLVPGIINVTENNEGNYGRKSKVLTEVLEGSVFTGNRTCHGLILKRKPPQDYSRQVEKISQENGQFGKIVVGDAFAVYTSHPCFFFFFIFN